MSKTRKSYDLTFKLKVANYAEKHNTDSAAKQFGLHRKQVFDWLKQKNQIAAAITTNKSTILKRTQLKRLSGNGRSLMSIEMDRTVYDWIVDQRIKQNRVCYKAIQVKAREVYASLDLPQDFKASRGWLQKFLKRHNFSLRRKTTVAQKDPNSLYERIVEFIIFSGNVITKQKISAQNIIAMDETAIFFDMSSATTVNQVGSKTVSLKTTGNEKAHATVVLAACADGKKLKPYVVFKGAIREVKQLRNEIKEAIIQTSKNGWMNDDLTKDWISTVYGKFAFSRRALVWDSYRCHISEAVKTYLTNFNTMTLVIPGGCTKYVQAPDVCWNKPFKDNLRSSYDKWIESGDKFYTKGGNMKAPSKKTIISWVTESWKNISADQIKKSFEVCGINLPTDGSRDHEIHCLKPGNICAPALDLLRVRRLQQSFENLAIGEQGIAEEDLEEVEKNEIIVYDSDMDVLTIDQSGSGMSASDGDSSEVESDS